MSGRDDEASSQFVGKVGAQVMPMQRSFTGRPAALLFQYWRPGVGTCKDRQRSAKVWSQTLNSVARCLSGFCQTLS